MSKSPRRRDAGMKILTAIFAAVALGVAVLAAPVCVDGVCYPSEEMAREAGVPAYKIEAAKAEHGSEAEPPETVVATETPEVRVAAGYMKAPQMVAFLRNEPAAKELADHALWMILLLVLAGGLAANLTPCVLPLVPVNLSLVGKGAVRGAAYGLGITCAYGCLGLAAAFGGLAFGTIQSSPWFSLLAACVFVFLGLAVAEVFTIDFSRFRPRSKRPSGQANDATPSLWKPFALGAWSAVLAGACVEPILIATLVLTAEWFAAGRTWSVVLPFILGAGMGLPWPFAAAGMKVLPRPGAWMRWVNRVFAVVMFGMAAWYGWLAWTAWQARSVKDIKDPNDIKGRIEATPESWAKALETARATGKPVFVDIWATWCKNCLAMESTTFTNADVKKELENFAVVRLQAEDFTAFAALPEFKDLGIKGIPAFVILPAESR